MKILILGATGMIGSAITAEAASRGHHVTAASRSGTATASATVMPLALDLHDVPALQDAVQGQDVVIATASARKTDDPFSETAAYAQALVDGVGDTRLIMVGGAGSLNLPDGTAIADTLPDAYRAEAQAMRRAHETILAPSVLNLTFATPPFMIQPGPRTGHYRVSDRTVPDAPYEISAEDYAVALIDETERAAHPGQIIGIFPAA
ncbi:hypothetical protein SAMN04488003_101277 [Loktanella fryxellensis]|uniref:NAD(P)-binding domain-containing protein n=1 Tax=Loktanella fryxellensis TaxID=245187 RepID=A0A1H7YRE0_9RHOB|nr:NAD(P)H-binding protein [Loktanella fryxellensis]SEM48640.1 hypothetical protein SAMN04488003_101277 [Loktanella fryxellensis]